MIATHPRAQYLSHKKQIDQALSRVLAKGHYILSEEVGAFEREFARYLGISHAIGVASGTDALHLALRAFGIGPGDEVITVSHTAAATVSAIRQCGATPVFADIEPASFCMDPQLLPKLINSRTRALVPVHLYGQPADMRRILEVAKQKNLVVIEDASQAHGAMYQGKKAGTWGDAACFSFYPTKNLGAIGDGGLITTRNKSVADKCRLLRQYGWDQDRQSVLEGFNSRLDELQAVILRVKLKTLDSDNRSRKRIADYYTRALRGLPITLPSVRASATHVFHQYVIRTKERDALRTFLKKKGVMAQVHYPLAIHQQKAYRSLGRRGALPVTEKAVKEILSLPIYPELSMRDAARVVHAVKGFFSHA